MRRRPAARSMLFGGLETHPTTLGPLVLNKRKFIDTLSEIEALPDLAGLKDRVCDLRAMIDSPDRLDYDLLVADDDAETFSLRADVLISELDQMLESRTLERAKYYLRRLERGVRKIKTSGVNDINLSRWKEYDNIITDSLWVLPKRDTSGAHLGWYWGNFIPQIPQQMMLRFTKEGDWVLDPFLGSGTTLIECKRLGRNGIGIELNAEVGRRSIDLIAKERDRRSVTAQVHIADSRTADIGSMLGKNGLKQVQLLIMHPPYHDILKFSEDDKDLSNANSTESFLKMFREVLDNVTPFLEEGRYLALVIGDKYSRGEWIPLGFYCMNEVINTGYSLKSIVVKNFDQTRAKRDQRQLWRYRALVGGFYIFKHEYVLLFKKT